jgi:hypothetical protein
MQRSRNSILKPLSGEQARADVIRSGLHSLLGWLLSGRARARSAFGPFAPVLLEASGEPAPLLLLSMRSGEASAAIDRIERALASEGSAGSVDAMLASPDWRPHLVAAVALILDTGQRLDPAPLWAAIDGGSWVTPQLVATAYLIDPSFPDRLRTRIKAGCPVEVPANLSPQERHRATGPASPEQRSAKMSVSLMSIGLLAPSLAGWLKSAANGPQLAALRAADRDHSGNIAENWLKNVESQFRSAGRTLAPAGRR